MVILTLILAVTNIALGLWLAIRLGFGPPTLTDAWDAFTCFEPSFVGDAEFLAATDLANHLDDLLDDDLDDDDFDFECIVAEEVEEIDKDVELDYEVSDMLAPTDPEYWDLSAKFVETSILKLVIAAIKTGVRMTSIDTALRSERENLGQERITISRDELLEDCEVYIEEQRQANDDLQKRLDTLTNQEVALRIASDLEIQTQKLAQAMARISEIDIEADLTVSVKMC